MRILMVTPRFPPHVGGTELHTFELARRTVRQGIDVTVATTELEPARVGTESIHGIHVIRVRAWPKDRDWYVAPDMARVVARGEWDVVHVQGIHTLVLPVALAAARSAGLPYVITLHSGGHSSRVRRWSRRIVWGAAGRWIRDAACIVAVSEFEKSEFGSLLHIPEPRLAVIPSGVDRPSNMHFGLLPTHEITPRIVSVGRLEEYKGHDRIVRALPAVAAQVPDVRLTIVGSGPDERRLRRMAAALGVADRVEIRAIPFQRREDLHALLAQARLVVALSAYESQGLAATEAAARGCSVLVADSSALRELVTARLACGVDRDSPEQVVAAVVAQLRSPHRPSGEIPTWEDCAAKTADVYTTAQRG